MDSVKKQDLQRLVKRASVVIAHYWPMTTFVHHNPIRSFGDASIPQRHSSCAPLHWRAWLSV